MSTFDKHTFIPYPDGHAVKTTCMKCGRPHDHELHNTIIDRCGFVWNAPYMVPTSSRPEYRRQVCILEDNHEGPHRSSSNVISGD